MKSKKMWLYYLCGIISVIVLMISIITVTEKKLMWSFLTLIFLIAYIYILWAILFKRIGDIRNSKYIRYIKKRWFVVFSLGLFSVILALISYPGMWYSDSYGRVTMSFKIEELFQASLLGNKLDYHTSYTPTMSVFMAIFMSFTDNIAFYTVVQAFIFFLAIYLFVDVIVKNNIGKLILVILILSSPLFYCNATYYEAGIGCLSGLMMLIVTLSRDDLRNSLDKYLQLVFTLISGILIFGYRINAFTVIPIIILMICVLYKKYKMHLFRLLITIVSSLIVVQMIPGYLGISVDMTSGEAFAWEIVTAIQGMPSDQKAEYIDYLDGIFGEGSTEKCINDNSENNICPILFGEVPVRSKLMEEGAESELRKKYIEFALSNKKQYLKTKWHFVSSMMGIEQPLNLWEWNYNRWDNMDQYRYNDSRLREAYYEIYGDYIEKNNLLLRPWILFLIAGVLLLIQYKYKYRYSKNLFRIRLFSYLIAVFYYGAFLINTQSMEFRYFYPSCVLLLLIILSFGIDVFEILIGKLGISIKKGEILLYLGKIYAYVWIPLFVSFVVLSIYFVPILRYIESIRNDGICLYSSDEVKIYYYDNSLVYFTDPDNDNTHTYYLHYVTTDSEADEISTYGFVNRDFSFAENSKAVPGVFGIEMAIVKIPDNFKVESVQTGQYEGDIRFWESEFEISPFLDDIDSFKLCDINDTNWSHGVSTSSFSPDANIILVESDNPSFEYLVGKTIVIDNTVETVVTDVVRANQYYRIYVADEFDIDKSTISVMVRR